MVGFDCSCGALALHTRLVLGEEALSFLAARLEQPLALLLALPSLALFLLPPQLLFARPLTRPLRERGRIRPLSRVP